MGTPSGEDTASGFRERTHAKLIEDVKDKPVITLLHSGDMGDIVSSLPVALELFKETGKKIRLLLDTTGGMDVNSETINSLIGKSTGGRGLKFCHSSFEFLAPLLRVQQYIDSVVEVNRDNIGLAKEADINLNFFRAVSANKKLNDLMYGNLMYSHQIAAALVFGYPGRFLEVPDSPPDCECLPERVGVLGRSTRYQSSQVFHQSMIPIYKQDFKFIGTDLEYRCLNDCLSIGEGEIPRVAVKDALDMAKVMDRSSVVTCNQTLMFWIAVGLKKIILHEISASYFVRNTITPDYPLIHYIRADRYHKINPETGMLGEGQDLGDLFNLFLKKDKKEEEKKENVSDIR